MISAPGAAASATVQKMTDVAACRVKVSSGVACQSNEGRGCRNAEAVRGPEIGSGCAAGRITCAVSRRGFSTGTNDAVGDRYRRSPRCLGGGNVRGAVSSWNGGNGDVVDWRPCCPRFVRWGVQSKRPHQQLHWHQQRKRRRTRIGCWLDGGDEDSGNSSDGSGGDEIATLLFAGAEHPSARSTVCSGTCVVRNMGATPRMG